MTSNTGIDQFLPPSQASNSFTSLYPKNSVLENECFAWDCVKLNSTIMKIYNSSGNLGLFEAPFNFQIKRIHYMKEIREFQERKINENLN